MTSVHCLLVGGFRLESMKGYTYINLSSFHSVSVSVQVVYLLLAIDFYTFNIFLHAI